MPAYFVTTFVFGWRAGTVGANISPCSVLFEIANVLVRLDHVASTQKTRATVTRAARYLESIIGPREAQLYKSSYFP